MVLQAAGLGAFAGDLGVIFAVDWLLDRVRAPPPPVLTGHVSSLAPY